MGRKWSMNTKRRLGKPKSPLVVNIEIVIEDYLIGIILLVDSTRQALPSSTRMRYL
jgi:hypothetical protein